MKSLSKQNKNKSATRGAQLVSIGIPKHEGRMWDLIVSVPDHCLSFYNNLSV